MVSRVDSAVQLFALNPTNELVPVHVNADGSISAGGSSGGSGGAVTIANGADVALGTTTDAAVVTNANGTVQQYLRGLVAMGANGTFNVNLATALSSLIDSVSTEGKVATYVAGWGGVTFATTPTNYAILVGSATKTVKIRRLILTVKATAAASWVIAFYKQSTDDTGGTATNPAKLALDSNNAAATAVVRQYSANPTVGTQVAIGLPTFWATPASAGGVFDGQYIYEFGNNNTQPIVLRGIAEAFAMSFAGQTPPTGGQVALSLEWTEE